MVKFMSIITRIASRCLDMGNFHIGVPVWPGSLAATLRGAARVIMQQVNAIGMKQINVGSNLHPVVVCLISIGTLKPVAVVFAAERCTVANTTRVVSVQGTVVYNLGGKPLH